MAKGRLSRTLVRSGMVRGEIVAPGSRSMHSASGTATVSSGCSAARMARARDEIAHWRDAEHVIVNDDFATALADVAAILRAARLSRARQVGLEGFVDALVR